MERGPRALFTHSVTPLKRKIKNFFFFSSSSSPSLLFFFCFSFRFSLLHLLFFAEYLSLDGILTMGKMKNLRIHRVVHVQQYPTFLSRTAHPPASRPQGPQRSRNASGDCPPPPLFPQNCRSYCSTRIELYTGLPHGRARACAQPRYERIMRGTRSVDRPLAGRIFTNRRLRIAAS